MTTWIKQNNWQRVSIKNVCSSIIDCVNKTAKTVPYKTSYKMLRTTNIKKGWIDIENVNFVTEETYKRWTRRQVPKKGDVILTREAPLGEVGLLRSDDKVFLGQRLVSYRADSSILDNKFLFYSFLAHDLQSQIKSFGSGSIVEHMRVPDAEKLTLLLPILDLQKEIASILSAYDDLIQNNQKRMKILEEMAQRLYSEWFVKFKFPDHKKIKMVDSPLGKIPEGWKVEKLIEIADLVMGQSPTSNYYNLGKQGLPFHQGVADFGDKYPLDRVYSTSGNRFAEKGDLLFSVRAPVGRMNIANKKIILGRGLCAIRRKDKLQTLLYLMFKQKFSDRDMIGNGAIYKSVNKAEIEGINLLKASDLIEKKFENIASVYTSDIEKLSHINQNLAETRDLLIPQLVTGRRELKS